MFVYLKTAMQRKGQLRPFMKAAFLSFALLFGLGMFSSASAQVVIVIETNIGLSPVMDNTELLYAGVEGEKVPVLAPIKTRGLISNPDLTPNTVEAGGLVTLTVYAEVTSLAISQGGNLVFSTNDVGSSVVIDPLAVGNYILTIVSGGNAYNFTLEIQ